MGHEYEEYLDDDFIDDFLSDEYYDGHYCSWCGGEFTLDEYLDHDLDICIEGSGYYD